MSDGYSGPYSMEPGRIEDFVKGMQDSKDTKAASAIFGVAVGIAADSAWSHFKRYLRKK